MDTSEEYIKMSQKAERIQKEWKPQEGDFWACPCDACVNRNAKTHIINDYDIDALNKRDLTNVDRTYAKMIRSYGRDFVDHFRECPEGITFLPRQDQLQEMIDYPFPSQLVQDFADWCNENHYYGIGEGKKFKLLENLGQLSMEQLWLVFVMEKKYNKIWNGKDWEKVK